MKYKLKSILLTLLAVTVCSWSMAAEEVVSVQLCNETAPFLFGCNQYSTSGTYTGVDVGGGVLKTLKLNYGMPSPVTNLEDSIEVNQTYLFACQQLTKATAGEVNTTETFTNASGCDSVVNLKLLFFSPIAPTCDTAKVTINDSIINGQSFLFGCQTLEAEGQYFDYLRKADGSCDSIVTLNLKFYTPEEPKCDTARVTINDSIVSGEKYLFGCQTLEAEGQYFDYLRKADGSCDSIVTLNLKFYVPSCDTARTIINDSIVSGEKYLFGCQTLEAEGQYFDYLRKADGSCDSIVTLNLKFYIPVEPECDTAKVEIKDTIQLGESYLFGCQIVTPVTVGDTLLSDTLSTTLGCDSIINLTLTVLALDPLDTTIVDTLCYGSDYTHRLGTLYNLKADTAFNDTVKNAVKVTETYYRDSIYRYELKVLPKAKDSVENKTICYGEYIMWRGKICYETTDYHDTLRYTGTQCDSVLFTLNLTVLAEAKDSTKDTTICYGESIMWRGKICDQTTAYYDTLRYTGTQCDSVHFTLNLTVTAEPIEDTKDTTICYGESIMWRGKICDKTTDYHDTLRYTGTQCDSVLFTLNLTVLAEAKDSTKDTTICYGEHIMWRGQDCYETKAYHDTLRYTGTQCDSVLFTLNLTVIKAVADTIVDTLCIRDAVEKYPQFDIKGSGIYCDTVPSVLGCDSVITTLYLTILLTPDNPDLSVLESQPLVVCGKPIDVTAPAIEFAAKIAMSEADTVAAVENFWFEVKYPGDAKFKLVTDKDTVKSYFDDQKLNIRIVLTTECGDTLRGLASKFEVLKPTPEVLPELDSLPAVSKYNNWLLMINYNYIVSLGYDIDESSVTWFKVVNGVDPIDQHIDDEPLGNGFYYTVDKSLTGEYYAIIDADNRIIRECGAVLRTVVIQCTTDGRMALAPNVIRPGETMNLRNIDPNAETQMWMYNSDGKLVDRIESEGTDNYTIQPQQGMGVYLLRVISGEMDESFKYVITK